MVAYCAGWRFFRKYAVSRNFTQFPLQLSEKKFNPISFEGIQNFFQFCLAFKDETDLSFRTIHGNIKSRNLATCKLDCLGSMPISPQSETRYRVVRQRKTKPRWNSLFHCLFLSPLLPCLLKIKYGSYIVFSFYSVFLLKHSAIHLWVLHTTFQHRSPTDTSPRMLCRHCQTWCSENVDYNSACQSSVAYWCPSRDTHVSDNRCSVRFPLCAPSVHSLHTSSFLLKWWFTVKNHY